MVEPTFDVNVRPYTGTGVTDGGEGSSIGIGVEPSINSPRTTGRSYVDFFGGTITCPSCQGTGKISRGQENELVALIPLSDKRLHPRRTKLYVTLSVVLCIISAGLLLFFLFPRSIVLRSIAPSIIPSSASFANHTEMYMTIVNTYNMSNENFFSVQLSSMTLSMIFNQKIINTAINDTTSTIPMRSTVFYHITMNITFSAEQDYVIQYCFAKPDANFLVPFQAMATFNYFQKSEQMTLNTYQYIHCSSKKSARSSGTENNINVNVI